MSSDTVVCIRRALISVSDKTGLDDFARHLSEKDVEILSTGGTQQFLEKHDIQVTSVSSVTKFPEIMGGRVKTLHPKIHGGILARRSKDEQVMVEHGIVGIDLVVANLYPFKQTIAQTGVVLEEAIEKIDIGGPAMVRAAAKNYQHVAVIIDPKDYSQVLHEIEAQGGISTKTRLRLAKKAFTHTADYDAAIAAYLEHLAGTEQVSSNNNISSFPETISLTFNKNCDLRYGENPHQQAAFYTETTPSTGTLATADLLQGKRLSYNNIADTDAALACVKAFTTKACVIVKHANPCGVALGDTPLEAYQRAFAADKTSAFGGIIAFNCPLDKETAETIISNQFTEVIIAPVVLAEALDVLLTKSNLRVLSYGEHKLLAKNELFYKRVAGGLLVQTADQLEEIPSDFNIVTQREPVASELKDLLFAWQVAKYVKSNAIVCAKNGQSVGIGAGQMSRVYSAKIAAMKAKDGNLSVNGAVMASDAFFPFRDGIDAAAERGISAVIQPGGSIRDQEIIDAANEYEMAMIFTGVRHFLH